MLKLIRSAAASAIATYAWRNRAQVMSIAKSLIGDKKGGDGTDSGSRNSGSRDSASGSAKTGYAETVDTDGLMTPEQVKRAANA